MESFRTSFGVLCLILALSTTIVGLRCDDLKNGDASSSPTPSEGIKEEVKGKHNTSYNNNKKVHVKSSVYYGCLLYTSDAADE